MTKFLTSQTIDRVKEAYNIVDIISDYLELKKSGSNYVGLCPFHNEKTPSFTVSEEKQFYHCFGCGASGDGINFLMKKENLDFPQAIRFIADRLGIRIEESEIDEELLREKEKLYEINRETARFFFANLEKNRKVQEYFYKRGISSQLIKVFGLGYALNSWDSLYNYLLEKGYLVEEIEKLGLIGARSEDKGFYDKFRNRLIFPIIDMKSRVIGFGGRVLDETMPKYLNSKESSVFNKGNNLYGLNLISKYSDRKKILLVEGYMDVIALFSKGIFYSVASLGTALTEQQGRLLKRFGQEIYICFDSDQAGIRASLKAIDILTGLNLNPKVVILPPSMDPDDYVMEKGKLAFESLVASALHHIDYRIYLMKKEYNLTITEDKIKFTKELAEIIKRLKSPVEQDAYLEKLSRETGISKEAIEKEAKIGKRGARSPVKSKQSFSKGKYAQPLKSYIPSGFTKAELDLFRIISHNMEYFDFIIKKIKLEDFSSKESKIFFQILLDGHNKKENLKAREIIELAIERKTNEEFIELLKEEYTYIPGNLEEVLNDLINRIIKNNLVLERDRLIKLIEDEEEENNRKEGKIEDLFLKLTEINIKIKKTRD